MTKRDILFGITTVAALIVCTILLTYLIKLICLGLLFIMVHPLISVIAIILAFILSWAVSVGYYSLKK